MLHFYLRHRLFFYILFCHNRLNMKRLIAVFIFLAAATVYLPAQQGLGIGGKGTAALRGTRFEPGAALTIVPPFVPLAVDFSWKYSGGSSRFAFCTDLWLVEVPLVDLLTLYAGPGMGIEWGGNDLGSVDFSALFRVPAGFRIQPAEKFEIFIELISGVSFLFVPDFTPHFYFQGCAGIRFWLLEERIRTIQSRDSREIDD